ncbi:hypothetical protein KXW38_009835, partial [Aspergillus fumigatus]
IEILARAIPKRDYYCQSRRGNRLFELGLGEIALAFTAASSKADQALIENVLVEQGGENFVLGLLMSFLRRFVAAGALAAILAGNLKPASALIVFDPSNYVQNVLTAARALQQINNQITSLQNQAQMLINQGKNLATLPFSSLQQLEQSILRTQQLLGQAQRIAYDIQQIDRAFSTTYAPASSSSSDQGLV